MKEAMWGLGLIMLCLLAFVIIGVLSNVTLTNQQDYYGVKQTSEATSYDSIDVVSYKRGICVCAKTSSTSGTVKINNVTEYTITEPDENNNCENKVNCELRIGEYVIDPKLFNENIIVRLGSIIKASEVYDIKVQEIIPYPPKISVYISYHQALNIEGNDTINSEIPNKFDGIFEDTGTQSVLTYANNNLTDWALSCGPKTVCYMDSKKWNYCPEKDDKEACEKAGYTVAVEVSSKDECVNVCYCKKNTSECGYYAKGGSWDGWETSNKCDDKPDEPEEPEIPQRTSGPCTWHNNKTLVTCKKSASCATKDYAACGCDSIPDSSGREQCKKGCSKCATCSSPARLSNGKCEVVETHFTTAKSGFESCDKAKSNCETQAAALCPAGFTASYTCYGWQKWEGTRNNKNKSPFSFTNSCTTTHSCSEYSPYINCTCKG